MGVAQKKQQLQSVFEKKKDLFTKQYKEQQNTCWTVIVVGHVWTFKETG